MLPGKRFLIGIGVTEGSIGSTQVFGKRQVTRDIEVWHREIP